MVVVSLIISILAVVLSFFTFIYNSIRRGKISISKPNAISMFRIPDANMFVACPITVINSGAVIHVVNNLICEIINMDNHQRHIFDMQMEYAKFPTQTMKEDDSCLATSFSVPPRSSVMRIIGFASRDSRVVLQPAEYILNIYVWLDGRKQRKAAANFRMTVNNNIGKIINSGIAYAVDYGGYFKSSFYAA